MVKAPASRFADVRLNMAILLPNRATTTPVPLISSTDEGVALESATSTALRNVSFNDGADGMISMRHCPTHGACQSAGGSPPAFFPYGSSNSCESLGEATRPDCHDL